MKNHVNVKGNELVGASGWDLVLKLFTGDAVFSFTLPALLIQ